MSKNIANDQIYSLLKKFSLPSLPKVAYLFYHTYLPLYLDHWYKVMPEQTPLP